MLTQKELKAIKMNKDTTYNIIGDSFGAISTSTGTTGYMYDIFTAEHSGTYKVDFRHKGSGVDGVHGVSVGINVINSVSDGWSEYYIYTNTQYSKGSISFDMNSGDKLSLKGAGFSNSSCEVVDIKLYEQELGYERDIKKVMFRDKQIRPEVPAPTNLVGVAGTLKATLTWTSATGESGVTWTEEKLVRKEGSAPQGSMDGTTVTTITTKDTYKTTGYEDTGLDSTKTYYYKVFAIYDNGTEKGSTDVNVTPNPYTPGANSLAYYPLDSTYGIRSYNGNYDLTQVGTALTQNSNYVEITNQNTYLKNESLQLNLFYQKFSIFGWFKSPTGTICDTTAQVGRADKTWYGFNLGLIGRGTNNAGKVRLEIATGGTGTSAYGERFTKNQWYNLFGVYENNVMKLYVNGEHVDSANKALGNWTNCYFLINNLWGSLEGGLGGYAMIGIDTEVWTDKEIKDFYNGTKGTFGL